MKKIIHHVCLMLLTLPAVALAQPVFKDKSAVQISQVKSLPAWSSMSPREITISIDSIPEHIVPVVVKIEDEQAGLFSPVAVKSIDYKSAKITFITTSGGKYVAVYVKDIFAK